MFRMVSVPLDLSTDGDRALAPAVVLARQFGVALELVVVSTPGLDPGADAYELQVRAERVSGVPTSTVVVEDDNPVETLAAFAADDERLICMGSHGGRLRELASASMALALVRSAHRPIVAVGPRQGWWPGPIGSVYVGVDERGVPESTLVLVDLWASALDAEVCLVHAQAPDQRDLLLAPGSLAFDEARTWMTTRGRDDLARWLVGDPTTTLVDSLARANRPSPLLVVTTRIETRGERTMHGSVAGRLVALSPVPVVIVPATVTTPGPSLGSGLIASDPRVGDRAARTTP